MPQREIKLLGGLNIQEAGQPTRIMTSAKGSALIAYLIITNQTHKREAVADLLWDATSTRHSLQNLRELLARIRKWVPELQITRQTIAIQPDKDTFIDLWALQAGLTSEALTTSDEALNLYTGDLLASFYVEGATRFNEWLLLERERLRRQVLNRHHYLCQKYAAQQAWQQGVAVAQRWLSLDGLDEDAYRWLMQCLAANGQTTAALQAYQTCRQTLWEELGIEPEAATTNLARQLTAQTTFLPAVSPPSLPTVLASNTLPAPEHLPPNTILPYLRNDDFVGREADLLQIATHFSQATTKHRSPVVAITGMGGIGKTQTAVEFCYRYGRYFTGGVYWLSFAEANTVAQEVAAIGGERGLGLFRQTDNLTLKDQVGRVQRAWQETIPRLLIFDNCETEALLQQWLPVTGGCHILVTSRRSTWARELRIKGVALKTLPLAESITLLQHFTPHLTPTEAQAIATEVDHLPLALHLAGSFLHRYTHISPHTYLHQLRQTALLQHPSLQGHGIHYSPTGHELHVGRTFALNLQQLNGPQGQLAHQLLSHIAAFAPGEPIPQTFLLTTLATSDDLIHTRLIENTLDHLRNLGFIRQEGDNTLLMHRLVAAFVSTTLPSDLNQAYTQIAQTIIEQLNKQLQNQHSLAKLPFASRHLHHLTEETLKNNAPHTAQLANHLGRHLHDIGHYEAAQHMLTTALTWQTTSKRENELEVATTYVHLGILAARLAHFETAQAHLEQALVIYERILGPNHLETGTCLKEIGATLREKGDYQQAFPYLRRALAITKQHLPPNHLQIGEIFNQLGILHSRTGNYKEAHPYLERALDIRLHNLEESHPTVGQALNNLGVLHLRRAAYQQARPYLEHALAIRQQELGDDHSSVATNRHNLGVLLLLMGEYQAAEDLLKKTVAIREKAFGKTQLNTVIAHGNLGWLYVLQGRYEQAQTIFHQVLTTHQDTSVLSHKQLAKNYHRLGLLYTHITQYQTAYTYLDKALTDYTHLCGPKDEATVSSQSALGYLLTQQGKLEQAFTHLSQALTIQQAIYNRPHPETAVTLHHLAHLHLQQQDLPPAKTYLNQSLQIRQTLLGPNHPDTAQTLTTLGHWYKQNGDKDTAQTYYQQAYTLLQNNVAPTHITLQQLHNILATSPHDTTPQGPSPYTTSSRKLY